MIIKLISYISIISFILVNGCVSSGGDMLQKNRLPQIIINGKMLESDTLMSNIVVGEIDKMVKDCDDYYELIVDDRVIETIKKDKLYIEVIFPELCSVETNKFSMLKFDRLLIPLSGKFYSGEQVTFFTGISGFSNTPVINSNGRPGLELLLSRIAK